MPFEPQTNYPEIEDDGSCPAGEAFFTPGFRRGAAYVVKFPAYAVVTVIMPIVVAFMFIGDVVEYGWKEAVEEFKRTFL